MSLDKLIRIYSKPMDIIPSGVSEGGVTPDAIEAVFFDVYGTLFISGAGDISIAARESGKNMEDIEALLRRYRVGKTPAAFLRDFYGAIERTKDELRESGIDYPEVDIEEIWRTVTGLTDRDRVRRCAVEYELIVNPVYPMPHAAELLARCREKGIPLGIISNAQFYTPRLFPSLMGLALGDLGFVEEFVFFSYLYGYCKPSLVLFEKAAAALEGAGIPVDRVLYVGNDMLKDIYPAVKTGFHTALFAGDGRSLNMREGDERLGGVQPDMVVTDFSQLMECVG